MFLNYHYNELYRFSHFLCVSVHSGFPLNSQKKIPAMTRLTIDKKNMLF
jgi:hypothetical protein